MQAINIIIWAIAGMSFGVFLVVIVLPFFMEKYCYLQIYLYARKGRQIAEKHDLEKLTETFRKLEKLAWKDIWKI